MSKQTRMNNVKTNTYK